MTNKIRISANHLQVGMTVIELDRPWIETPFLLQGFSISNQRDIKAIQEYCDFVYIDATSSPAIKLAKSNKKDIQKDGYFNNLYKKRVPVPTTSVEKEISTAFSISRETHSLVRSCMDDIVLGNALNEEVLKQNVTQTVESIIRNPDAMLWLTRLREKQETASMHSVNCCILSVAFGRYLGLPKIELEKLAISALMHDIGQLQIPTELLNKPDTLSSQELKQFRMHPIHSKKLLMSAGPFLSQAVDVAYTHHERLDGSGYPRQLTTEQISPFSKMMAIIDTYDSMTTEQEYRQELSPFEALKYLSTQKGRKYDENLVTSFIKMIGVFPVGSLVELTTGEICIVITSNREDNLRPKVLIVLDENKQPQEYEISNLASDPVDALGRPVKILKTLRKGDYGIDQDKFVAAGIEFTVLN